MVKSRFCEFDIQEMMDKKGRKRSSIIGKSSWMVKSTIKGDLTIDSRGLTIEETFCLSNIDGLSLLF